MSSSYIHETLIQMLCTYKLLTFFLSKCIYSIIEQWSDVIMEDYHRKKRKSTKVSVKLTNRMNNDLDYDIWKFFFQLETSILDFEKELWMQRINLIWI